MKTIILFCCLLCCNALFAQNGRKAGKYYNAAMRSWSHYQRSAACEKLQRAIGKDPKNPLLYSQLGQWYFLQHRFADAVQAFRDGAANCLNGKMQFARPLAKCLIYAGRADSALQVIGAFATIKDSAAWNKLRAQATFVRNASRVIYQQRPASLGPRVNSKYPDVFPSMAADTQVIYFTRRVKNMDEDFYFAKADSCGEWLAADNMGAPPNTISNESAQFISADGHYLFFSRSDNRSENGWAEGGYDLLMAYRVGMDSEWTTPQPFGATINTPDYEGMPSLSPDNRQLFFVSDRKGGYGGFDIWISVFENGYWQMPYNAGPSINTAGNETAPYISMDNKTLFFTSDGQLGFGGTDIFRSEKKNDSTWLPAVNLGYPINTPFDEQSEWVVTNGRKLLFASDRQGPPGNFDIYETALPGNMQPVPVSILQGFVYDSISKVRLNSAAIYLMNAATGDTIYQFMSNRGDASYMLPLHMNTVYAMHTARIGYTEVRDTFTFDKQYTQVPYNRNVAMLTYDYVHPIFDSLLATIHFNVMKVELTDSDKTTIYKAIEPFLLDSRGVMVYVNGFTDNTGNPMLNEELSTKRANLVAKVLVDMGIEDLSIIAKGWGEAKMIAPNDTEEGQKKNRRVEIVLRRG